jgi:hypothetical protein
MVSLPLEVVDAGLKGLLADGCVTERDGVLVVRNFIEAQEAVASDKLRQAKHRELRRDEASRNVTECHAQSRAVTGCHEVSRDVTPSLAVPSLPSRAEPKKPAGAVAPPPKAQKSEDGRHAQTIAAFKAIFEVVHPGTTWRYSPADGPGLKRILSFPEATSREIAARLDHAFRDEWFRQHGTLAIFCSKWPTWTPAKGSVRAYGGLPSQDQAPQALPSFPRSLCSHSGCGEPVFLDAIQGPQSMCVKHHIEQSRSA